MPEARNFLWIGRDQAPSLFHNESGQVPNSTAAADILSPLFSKMFWTACVCLPVAMLAQVGVWMLAGGLRAKSLVISCALMGLALCGELYSGLSLTPAMHGIREELKAEFGGYHLVEKDHPERARFSKLHGISMSILMLDLALGMGALWCLITADPKKISRDA